MRDFLFVHSIEINRQKHEILIRFCDENQSILDTKLIKGPLSYNGEGLGWNEGYYVFKTLIREDRRVRMNGNEINLKVGNGPGFEYR